jgi:hypothetical protein
MLLMVSRDKTIAEKKNHTDTGSRNPFLNNLEILQMYSFLPCKIPKTDASFGCPEISGRGRREGRRGGRRKRERQRGEDGGGRGGRK